MSAEFEGGFAGEAQSDTQYDTTPQQEPSQYQSPFQPEVDAALREWFEGQIGPHLAPLREAQMVSETTRSIESFERQNGLTKPQMNEVLETVLSFGEETVNKMPTVQLLDYALRVWAGGHEPTTQQEIQSAALPPGWEQSSGAGTRRTGAEVVHDAFTRANETFEQMLEPDRDSRERLNELRDGNARRVRGVRTKFDDADEHLARRIRETA